MHSPKSIGSYQGEGDMNTANGGYPVPVYEALAADIKSLGVEAVFGLMSDDTVLFVTALDIAGITFHGARHENAAISMAEGYAYASGSLGIAVVGRGPATANGLHSAVYAARTGSRVLIIYGDAAYGTSSTNALGPDYKAFNALGVLTAAGLQVFRATSAAGARTSLADAAGMAMQGNAVALLLPTSIQLAKLDWNDADPAPSVVVPETQAESARPEAVQLAVDCLGRSQRPLIIAGLGAHRAGAKEALEQLADRLGALLLTTARAKEMFRGHPYQIGIIGSFTHSVGRHYIDQADSIIVFGASLNFWTTSFGSAIPAVPLIQVDSERTHVGQWYSADVALVGDAKQVCQQLMTLLPTRSPEDKPFHTPETRQRIAEFDPVGDFQAAHTARTIDPRSLGIALDRILPEQRNLVYDAGNFLGIVPYISVPGPDQFKFTTNFASIGLGFGTALGVARARPDSTTVLIVGDGGFLMTLSELETVVREDLPLIIVVMNDCAYGAELHFLKMHQRPVGLSVFPDLDFAPIAEGFAFEAFTIRTMDDLEQAAPSIRSPEGPILLDCKINADIAGSFMSELAAFEGGED